MSDKKKENDKPEVKSDDWVLHDFHIVDESVFPHYFKVDVECKDKSIFPIMEDEPSAGDCTGGGGKTKPSHKKEIRTELPNYKGKELIINEEKVGRITKAERVERIPEDVEVTELTFTGFPCESVKMKDSEKEIRAKMSQSLQVPEEFLYGMEECSGVEVGMRYASVDEFIMSQLISKAKRRIETHLVDEEVKRSESNAKKINKDEE